jgi:hypothetical protein
MATAQISKFQYLSPKPSSILNSKETNIIIRQTRCITGIDPFKFSQYGVMFYKSKKGDVVDCETALENANFRSNRPYYLVRAYNTI